MADLIASAASPEQSGINRSQRLSRAWGRPGGVGEPRLSGSQDEDEKARAAVEGLELQSNVVEMSYTLHQTDMEDCQEAILGLPPSGFLVYCSGGTKGELL